MPQDVFMTTTVVQNDPVFLEALADQRAEHEQELAIAKAETARLEAVAEDLRWERSRASWVKEAKAQAAATKPAGSSAVPSTSTSPAPAKSRASNPASREDFQAARLAYNSDPALQQQHGSFDSYWRTCCNLPDSPATAARKADAAARATAAGEWDNDPTVRAGFSAKENYVNYRVAELGGKLRMAGQR
jgi:hypothetical protein